VLLFAVVVFLALTPIEEYDLWFHMAFAREILRHGEIPAGDVFSFTSPGREHISTGWLAAIILYGLWEWVGKGVSSIGIALFILAHVVAAYFAVYAAAVRRRVEPAMAIVLLPALLVACLRFNPRPDLCSQLMVALVMLVLVTSERMDAREPVRGRGRPDEPGGAWPPGSRRLWLLPPLMVLWANLHVGFMAGVGAIGIYAAYRALNWAKHRRKADLLALIPCALSGVIWILNPYGVGVLKLPAKIRAASGVTTMLFEWMPLVNTDGHNNLPWFAYAGLVLLLGVCALGIALRTTRVPWWHWATAGFFLLLLWNARRHLGMVALVLPVLMLPHLDGLACALRRKRFLAPALAGVGAFALCALEFSGNLVSTAGLPTTSFLPGAFPEGATRFLVRHRPPANLFNSYHFGGYLMYHLGPGTKVFIDGRIDTYDPAVWLDDRAIEAGTMTIGEACRRYGLKTFVLDARPGYDPGNLVGRLGADPAWQAVYRDVSSVVFVLRLPETEAYLKEAGGD
jgi:hypothetical protein